MTVAQPTDAIAPRGVPAPAAVAAPRAGGPLELRVSPVGVTRALAGLVLLFIATSVLVAAVAAVRGRESETLSRLSLDGERTIPAFVAGSLLLLAAGLLAVISFAAYQRAAASARHWAVLALIFVALAVDEAVGIHEAAIPLLRNTLDAGGIFHFAWVLLAIPLVAGFAVAYLRFGLALPPRTRLLFGVAFVLVVGGGIGVELGSGLLAQSAGEDSLAYQAVTTVEETMEFAGFLVFLYGLLDYLGRYEPALRIRFG